MHTVQKWPTKHIKDDAYGIKTSAPQFDLKLLTSLLSVVHDRSISTTALPHYYARPCAVHNKSLLHSTHKIVMIS